LYSLVYSKNFEKCPVTNITFSGLLHGFKLLDDIDREYVNEDLWQFGRKAKLYSDIGYYTSYAGIGIGIIGALATRDNDRYYPISIGLLTLFSGWYIESKSRHLKKDFIYRYNKELYGKIN